MHFSLGWEEFRSNQENTKRCARLFAGVSKPDFAHELPANGDSALQFVYGCLYFHFQCKQWKWSCFISLPLSLSVSSCVHAFRDCRWLHNFATFYEFGFVLFTAISFSTSFSFFLLSFRIRIFIIAFACYAVISSLFTLALRCEAEQGKIRTGKKTLNEKRIIFALKNCCTKVIEEITRRHATMVTAHTLSPNRKIKEKQQQRESSSKKSPNLNAKEINADCWKAARKR